MGILVLESCYTNERGDEFTKTHNQVQARGACIDAGERDPFKQTNGAPKLSPFITCRLSELVVLVAAQSTWLFQAISPEDYAVAVAADAARGARHLCPLSAALAAAAGAPPPPRALLSAPASIADLAASPGGRAVLATYVAAAEGMCARLQAEADAVLALGCGLARASAGLVAD